MAEPFRLFRLPKLVIKRVLLLQTPMELIQLTTVSRRTKESVKSLAKSKGIGMKISIIRNDLTVVIGNPEDFNSNFARENELLPLGSGIPACCYDLRHAMVKKIQTRQLEEFEEWLTLIRYVFRGIPQCNISLLFCTDDIVESTLQLLDGFDIKAKVEFSGAVNSRSIFGAIMKACSQAIELEVQASMEKKPRFKDFSGYSLNKLKIHGEWITLGNLCGMRNCGRVQLSSTGLGAGEINYFLKMWIMDSTMKFLHLRSWKFLLNPHSIFAGLKLYANGSIIDGRKINVHPCVKVIQRLSDGVFAKICVDENCFILEAENSETCVPFFI